MISCQTNIITKFYITEWVTVKKTQFLGQSYAFF